MDRGFFQRLKVRRFSALKDVAIPPSSDNIRRELHPSLVTSRAVFVIVRVGRPNPKITGRGERMEQPYDYGTQEGYMDQQQQGYGDTNESEKLLFFFLTAWP